MQRLWATWIRIFVNSLMSNMIFAYTNAQKRISQALPTVKITASKMWLSHTNSTVMYHVIRKRISTVSALPASSPTYLKMTLLTAPIRSIRTAWKFSLTTCFKFQKRSLETFIEHEKYDNQPNEHIHLVINHELKGISLGKLFK